MTASETTFVSIDGFSVRLDCADLGMLDGMAWHVYPFGQGERHYAAAQRGQERVYLHRHLLGMKPGDGLFVDHINGDGLDNTRANLRVCTPKENAWNKRARRGKSGLMGVYETPKGKFIARFHHDGETVYLGHFNSAVEAAARVNVEMARRRGAFAAPNHIDRAELEAVVGERIKEAEAEIADLRSLLVLIDALNGRSS